MALYIVALTAATFAAMGVERLERGEGKQTLQILLGAAGLTAILALAGVFGEMAVSLAGGLPPESGDHVQAAMAAGAGIRVGALGSAVALAVVAGLCLAFLAGRVQTPAFCLLLVTLVGADFFRAGEPFWNWSRPEQELYAPDAIIRRLQDTPQPARVLQADVYRQMSLMRFEIPQVLGGIRSIELSSLDGLLGLRGENDWTNLGHLHLWNLMSVRFVILPDTQAIPGYHQILGPVTTGAGRTAYLYEADTAPPYLRIAPAAAKVDSGQVVPTLIDPRLDFSRLVLFDQTEAINPLPVTEMPARSPSHATFSHWSPGRMSIVIDPAPPQDSYLLIAENWYPDWHATVDGQPTTALRGDQTLLTVPVKAGARQVELQFSSRYFALGKLITMTSLLLLLAWAGVAVWWRRAHQGG
jgi:hypothetical protein